MNQLVGKRCPRGHTAMFQDRDQYGLFEFCLFCGWTNNGPVAEPAHVKSRRPWGDGPRHLAERNHFTPWRERERRAWEREDES